MRELTDIVAAYAALTTAGKPSALATVVGVEGSAYRRPGARMLIAEDGRTWGGVSGGCLERDVAARGRGVIASGTPFIVRYDTGSEEAVDRGVTTGCGGTIDVLIQPLGPAAPGPLTVLTAVVADNVPHTLVTVVRSNGVWHDLTGSTFATCRGTGFRLVSSRPQKLKTRVEKPCHEAGMPSAIQAAISRPFDGMTTTVHVQTDDASAELFLARVLPPQRLVLVGGGPDVVPVVRIARTLGWRVAVVAARPALALHERFAEADERYVTGPDAPLAGVPVDERDAVVVMTHNLARDAAALAALPARPRFLGVLGPAHRSQRLLDPLPASHPARSLRSPVGLDVGADTPEEIALSIVAGVQAALRGRPGGVLAERGHASCPIRSLFVTPAADEGAACPV